jgi:hypothetical protein
VTCDLSSSLLFANGGSTGIHVFYNQLAPADYPFQITGSIGTDSHTVNGILRVGDFSASLDKTTATLSPGQSATLNVTLTSINHYVAAVSIFCQPASQAVSCTVSPSPAPLGDGGTATVKLTIARSAGSAALRAAIWELPAALWCIVSLTIVLTRRRNWLSHLPRPWFLWDCCLVEADLHQRRSPRPRRHPKR